ncbi:hypothetical protein PIB30_040772 [Stylosanthes scabra]|uniref:Uncharacterized protein n=1 Tax=Stylosanthes scabra TaxID=79078 RepID=A0ABU6ZDF7_9FABA|nr:hypothetical protein [Stylosanthes scabra]
MIHDWISLKVEDWIFEVFAKEFGSEIYSIQSHPNMEDICYDFGEDRAVESLAVHAPAANGRFAATDGNGNLNLQDIDDPKDVNDERICVGNGWCEMDHDPMRLEAHLGNLGYVHLPLELGHCNMLTEAKPSNDNGSSSLGSCPYLPGFVVSEIPVVRDAVAGDTKAREKELEPLKSVDTKSESSETRYCINREPIGGVEVAVDSREVDDDDEEIGGGDGGLISAYSRLDDDISSEETLYRINPDVFLAVNGDARLSEFGGISGADAVSEDAPLDNAIEEDDGVEERVEEEFAEEFSATKGVFHVSVPHPSPSGVPRSEDGVVDHGENEVNSANSAYLSDETLYRINSNFENEQRRVEGENSEFESEGAVGEEWDPVEDEDSSAEIIAAKEIWCRAGLFIGSSEEEEIHSKLVRQKKVEGKRQPNLRPEEQRQGKKPPCIQGRSFATRKLMSGTKPKLR